MRALVKAEDAPGLWLRDQPEPEPGPDDVLIRIKRTGICGTDLHIYQWDDWARRTVPVPMIVGHEFAGEVVALGANVRHLREGQRVSGEGHLVSMNSRATRSGHFHLDPETRGIGVNAPGAFADYLVLPAFNAVPLPDAIPDEIGAILDPLGNAVHTALSFDLVGEDVLITGAGPIGIMAAAVARHVGARHVVVTDVKAARLNLARQVADVETVNVAEDDLHAVMKRLGMREGFDIGLEMSGSVQALDQLMESVVMGGRIAMLGIPDGRVPVDLGKLVFRMLTLKGIYGREIFDTWYKMLAMLESGLDVSRVITHRLPVDRFEEGFQAMAKGESGKVVLAW